MKTAVPFLLGALGLLFGTGILHAADPPNWGKHWKALPPVARQAYLEGFDDGVAALNYEWEQRIGGHEWDESNNWVYRGKLLTEKCWESAVNILGEASIAAFLLSPCGSLTIEPVITSLYNDPANTFIGVGDMVSIACKKIRGEDVEPVLRKARGDAVKRQEAVDRILSRQKEKQKH